MPFRDEAFERRGPEAPIEVELGAQSDSELYCDLRGSVVGVFASTFLVCARDVHVHILVSFPDGRRFYASGIVQFVRTAEADQLPGLGIAFTDLAADDREVLAQFAERVRPPRLYEE